MNFYIIEKGRESIKFENYAKHVSILLVLLIVVSLAIQFVTRLNITYLLPYFDLIILIIFMHFF